MDKMKRGGEPAFPTTWWDVDSVGGVRPRAWYEGMTLRQWFAGQALPGLIALDLCADVKEIVSNAYQYADAMLQKEK